jgi:hypothetical protein
MKKQIVIKIIGSAIIFSFAMFFSQVILPSQTSAAALNWENPNASGNNPYKFKPQDALNSQMIMQVVGCTGVVDSVTTAITNFAKGALLGDASTKASADAKRLVCLVGKKIVEGAAAIIPYVNTQGAIADTIECNKIQATADPAVKKAIDDGTAAAAAAKKRQECFDGIAATLAKNQLTAMTRYTMNWVNTGFNGNPLYVKDITSLTNSLEYNILETGTNLLLSPSKAFPYGSDFATSAVTSYKSGSSFRSGTTNFLDSLVSDMGSFVTDPKSYYTNEQLNKSAATMTALQRAQQANDAFANDFSMGGWNAWLALTQRDQNNPLGFTMQTSQYLADQQASQVQEIKDEVLQNNGFLSQKKCVLWDMVDAVTKDYIYDTNGGIKTTTNPQKQDVCDPNGWDVVTPGSLIKDKVSTYIDSPERQLELSKTINDFLNSVFANLVGQFQNQGLASLSSGKYTYTSTDMGGGPGSNIGSTDLFGNTTSSSSGYVNGSFDLTRDLGNTFIHSYQRTPLGTWNAKINVPKLSIGVAPVDANGFPLVNVYYVVNNGVDSNGKDIVGQTKLFENGYNNWENGDRAFWNGSAWQNWKKVAFDKKTGGVININPIAKRGVIQIQKDYVVAAKEILMILPSIMPKIGELDYCIPGPNPNWSTNATETQTFFTNFAGSLTASYKKGRFLVRKSNTYSIATNGDAEYDDYRNVFKYTVPNWWNKVTSTSYWAGLISRGSIGTVKGTKNIDKVQADVDAYLEKINTDIRTFNDSYGSYIDNLYGPKSLMQTQFFQNETTADLIPNPAWLPMATEGLDITKDIVSYNDDIVTTGNSYKDAIIKANSNISQLSLIKDKVSAIIKAAQKRRYDELRQAAIDNSTNIQYNKNLLATSGIDVNLTEAEYNVKYKNCLAEEDIVYYDDLSIMGAPVDESNRCNDGIDNDLNGLIDSADRACSTYVAPVEPNYVCVLDTTPSFASLDAGILSSFKDDTAANPIPDDTLYCTQRNASQCTTLGLYYSSGIGMKCKFSGN